RGDQFLGAKQYVWVNDRLTRVIDALTGPIDYTHDVFGNLAAAGYADGRIDLRMPDAVGNLLRPEQRTDRKYGPAGQLLEAHGPDGITRYEYDPEGNLVAKIEPTGAMWVYQWNGAGMLSRVIRPDGRTVAFQYDALGRRIAKRYRDKITRWIWDGNVPLHEWIERAPPEDSQSTADLPALSADMAASLQQHRASMLGARPSQGPPEDGEALDEALRGTPDAPITWLFEPESFAPLGKLVAGERFGIVTDHVGTPTGMYDGRGRESWAAEPDTYGDLRTLRGARTACPFRQPGQYEDPETGLYYNRFRYYQPGSGGFISTDPLRWLSGPRPFAHVRDPVIHTDPFGLMDPWDIQFSQDSIGNTFTDPNSSWCGRTLDEAIEEARRTGSLPEGLTLNVQE